MKRLMKLMSIMMTIVMLAVAISPIIFASSIDPGSVTPVYDAGSSTGIKTIGQKVLGVLTNIGIVVSVLIIAGLGIKYIVGSAEEKAEYKKSFVPLLVGMVLLLGASLIAKFLVSVGTAATSTGE